MSKRDPLVLLEDIMLAIQKISRYTSQMDRDAFLSDDLVIDAVARNLEIIGEAARQLPEDFRRAHAQIPWTQIGGLRNRIVHDYFGLDLEIIWEIIQHDLPELEKQVRALQWTLIEQRHGWRKRHDNLSFGQIVLQHKGYLEHGWSDRVKNPKVQLIIT